MNEIINANTDLLPDGYAEWRKDIEHLIEVANYVPQLMSMLTHWRYIGLWANEF